MKSGKRNMIWITVVLVFIVLLGAGIVLTVRRNAEARRQPDEMLVLVERGDLKVWVTGNSSVSAALEETVRTDVTGTIETYLLYEGQVVSAGDQLATLSVQELSIQIERARLDVSMRERELNNLKEEQTTTVVSAPAEGTVTWLMRDGDWVQRGSIIARISLPEQLSQENIPEQSGQEQAGDESIVVTPEEITAVIVEVRAPATGTITSIMAHNEAVVSEGQALAEIQDLDRSAQIEQQIPLRKIQIRQAQLDLADLQTRQKKNRDGSVIHAPISGTVIIPEPASAFSVGMDIPQGTVLASIVDYTELEVIVPVDELDINKVREGQTVIVTVEALPGQIIEGEVTMISSRGKIMGGVTTFDVTVAIAPVEGLKIGMNARADILVDQRIDTLLVPIEAVFEQEGESMVMVASGEQGAGNRPVKVVTGGHDTFFIEILSGVSEGQQIVIQGAPTDLVRPGGTNGNFGPFQGSDE